MLVPWFALEAGEVHTKTNPGSATQTLPLCEERRFVFFRPFFVFFSTLSIPESAGPTSPEAQFPVFAIA